MPDFATALFTEYNRYREKKLKRRRFKHAEIVPLITGLTDHPGFNVTEAGRSVEDRKIYHVSWGSGPVSVMMWSQMHGDESTATMALFDLFRFLYTDDEWKGVRQLLSERLTLHFIPMLNPDGAERFQRYNALGIDINRDTQRLAAPESQILTDLCSGLKPDFGFNLHDQNIHSSVGRGPEPATISFLAPPVDDEKTITPAREKAIRLIMRLSRTLSTWIPDNIARYPEAFEPRAFGDTIQKSGTSTILIESGGFRNDPEKQFIRKLNFVCLAEALDSIAENSHQKEKQTDYFRIPENQKRLFDLLIRHARFNAGGISMVDLDIGINRQEITIEEDHRYFYRSSIEDMGDLSTFYGYEEIDAGGMELVLGKTYPEPFKNEEEVRSEVRKLLDEGYTNIKLSDFKKTDTNLPLNICVSKTEETTKPVIGGNADFILKHESGDPVLAIINGFVFDLRENRNGVKNGFVY